MNKNTSFHKKDIAMSWMFFCFLFSYLLEFSQKYNSLYYIRRITAWNVSFFVWSIFFLYYWQIYWILFAFSLLFLSNKIDIQEFYELTLLDDTKTIQQKTVETLQIASKWEQENSLKINASEVSYSFFSLSIQ